MLINAFWQRPDPQACVDAPANLVDHLFYRGPYEVTQMEVRCSWPGVEVSDHPWVFAELTSPSGGFVASYGAAIKPVRFAENLWYLSELH